MQDGQTCPDSIGEPVAKVKSTSFLSKIVRAPFPCAVLTAGSFTRDARATRRRERGLI